MESPGTGAEVVSAKDRHKGEKFPRIDSARLIGPVRPYHRVTCHIEMLSRRHSDKIGLDLMFKQAKEQDIC